MDKIMCEQLLLQENVDFQDTGGRSQENRGHGFLPAFFDVQTETVYLSRFADGRPAPCHMLDGLPEEVVLSRASSGHVAAVKASVISGFVFDGRFYTRDDAVEAVSRLN